MLNIFLQKGVHLTHGPHFGHARCKKYHILVSAMVQIQNLEWSSFSPPILSFSNWFKTRRTLLESWSSLTNLQNVYRSLKEKDKTCLYHPFFSFHFHLSSASSQKKSLLAENKDWWMKLSYKASGWRGGWGWGFVSSRSAMGSDQWLTRPRRQSVFQRVW